ncbi:hypothetical protein NKH69_09980 [Mesorhizobium sp. M0976]
MAASWRCKDIGGAAGSNRARASYRPPSACPSAAFLFFARSVSSSVFFLPVCAKTLESLGKVRVERFLFLVDHAIKSSYCRRPSTHSKMSFMREPTVTSRRLYRDAFSFTSLFRCFGETQMVNANDLAFQKSPHGFDAIGVDSVVPHILALRMVNCVVEVVAG